MKKKIKMMLYGVPGVGKSVFALQFPKPFFITTDGNYEWLDEFGAKEQDHIQLSNFKQFVEILKVKDFSEYETIVIDLIEDLFKWCEDEFIKKNKIDHIGDMAFGKGYRMTRDDFFGEISKLIALPKNIILLSHESSNVVKDKRGVESTLYYPSKTLPESLRDQIEGRMRYVLRAKFEDEIDGKRITQRRILSLAGDSNEFSIIRGVDMSKIKEKIDLNYEEFIKELRLDEKTKLSLLKEVVKKEEPKLELSDEKIEDIITKRPQSKVEVKKEEVRFEPKKEDKVEVKREETKSNNKEDIMAAIRAKLAKMKEGK